MTLNTIFTNLSHRAHLNQGQYLDATERHMRLALKVQGQCRATLATLATVKNPLDRIPSNERTQYLWTTTGC
jgi:hypothetical protein